MELRSEDCRVKLFHPADGTESAAIKLHHRQTRSDVVVDEEASRLKNLRLAVGRLVDRLNPNPDHITKPTYHLFDRVQVHLPSSTQSGHVSRMMWDFRIKRWKYYVDSPNKHVNQFFDAADLSLDEEIWDD